MGKSELRATVRNICQSQYKHTKEHRQETNSDYLLLHKMDLGRSMENLLLTHMLSNEVAAKDYYCTIQVVLTRGLL